MTTQHCIGTNPSLWATHTNPKKKWKLQRKLGKGSFGEVKLRSLNHEGWCLIHAYNSYNHVYVGLLLSPPWPHNWSGCENHWSVRKQNGASKYLEMINFVQCKQLCLSVHIRSFLLAEFFHQRSVCSEASFKTQQDCGICWHRYRRYKRNHVVVHLHGVYARCKLLYTIHDILQLM